MASRGRRRLNTVHDLAALRLHPDGSRVPPDAGARGAVEVARRAGGGAKRAIRDAAGHWIAPDAGGSVDVPRRPVAPPPPPADGAEEFDVDGIPDEAVVSEKAKGKRKAADSEPDAHTGPPPKERARSKRRKAFDGDLRFLAGSATAVPPPLYTLADLKAEYTSPALPGNGPSQSDPLNDPALLHAPHAPTGPPELAGFPAHTIPAPSALPVAPRPDLAPSSDLLKAIHHFASSFFAARGELLDGARTVRAERKRAWKARRAAAAAAAASGDGAGAGTLDDSTEGGRASPSALPTDHAGSSVDSTAAAQLAADAGPPAHSAAPRRDMYRAFDGSALLALGMLLEAHVVQLVAPRIPPDWVGADADEEEDAGAGAAAPPDPADDANGDDPTAHAGAPGPQAPADAAAGVRGGRKKRKKRARPLAAAFARAEPPGTAPPVGDGAPGAAGEDGAPPGAAAEDGDMREVDPADEADEALASGDAAVAGGRVQVDASAVVHGIRPRKRRKRKEDVSIGVDV